LGYSLSIDVTHKEERDSIMRPFSRILPALLSLALALVAFSAQAQHMNSNPNDPNGTSQQSLRNSSGVTGYRSAEEYLKESNEQEEKERAEREKRMKALESFGDPLAPTGQSFGQSYSKPPFNGITNGK
jgi:hypothetical protein